jgi:rod shape-determining protein MreD
MRYVLLLGLIYVALVADATAGEALAVGGIRPAWLLLAATVALSTVGDGTALAWAALAGLLHDCLGAGGLGAGMLCATTVAWLVRRTTRLGPGESLWLVAAIGLPALVAMHLGTSILSALVDRQPIAFISVATRSLQTAALTGAIGLALRLALQIAARCLPRALRTSARTSRHWSVSK